MSLKKDLHCEVMHSNCALTCLCVCMNTLCTVCGCENLKLQHVYRITDHFEQSSHYRQQSSSVVSRNCHCLDCFIWQRMVVRCPKNCV